MSWELVCLLGLFMVCATVVICVGLPYASEDQELDDDEGALFQEIIDLRVRVIALEQSHEAIIKLAEETKKMLSEANLAKGFGRR